MLFKSYFKSMKHHYIWTTYQDFDIMLELPGYMSKTRVFISKKNSRASRTGLPQY